MSTDMEARLEHIETKMDDGFKDVNRQLTTISVQVAEMRGERKARLSLQHGLLSVVAGAAGALVHALFHHS